MFLLEEQVWGISNYSDFLHFKILSGLIYHGDFNLVENNWVAVTDLLDEAICC